MIVQVFSEVGDDEVNAGGCGPVTEYGDRLWEDGSIDDISFTGLGFRLVVG